MSLQDIDSSFQFGEDPPWADDPPEIDREKANAELESMQRILHPTSGLYCEHGHGPYQKETHIFLSKEDNVPMQILHSDDDGEYCCEGHGLDVGDGVKIKPGPGCPRWTEGPCKQSNSGSITYWQECAESDEHTIICRRGQV